MQTRRRGPGVRGAAAAALGAIAALGCSPTFNWRETRPAGSGAALMFPCRPTQQGRSVRIGASVRPMQIHSCKAGEALFMLATIDVTDPAEVTPLLAGVRVQAAANLAGATTDQGDFAPAGATPNAQSGRVRIVGARADGQRVVAQAAFFVKGLRLYQATVLGAEDASGREAADTFLAAIRLP